jgi:Ca-activated chloride channel family protein
VSLYTIGLLSSGYANYGKYGETGKSVLKQLADVTGGASFFPDNINQVEEICKRIARDLRNQYTIGYRPSNAKLDGSWRKVQVRLNRPQNTPKLKIRTKQGYYAPLPRESNGTTHLAEEYRK